MMEFDLYLFRLEVKWNFRVVAACIAYVKEGEQIFIAAAAAIPIPACFHIRHPFLCFRKGVIEIPVQK